MLTAIDKAGRVVIPKSLRDQFRLGPGQALELVPDGDEIRLRVPRSDALLVEKGGILVHCGTGNPSIDVVDLVNQLRDARTRDIVGPLSAP